MEINQKGQSSIGDAMFFLMIVALLSGAVFFFLSDYGETAKQELTRQYRSQFGVAAIETLLAINVPRSACAENVLEAKEVDTMLAMMKEDFADNLKFENDTKKIFKDQIENVMLPIANSFDYLFYIHIPDTSSIAPNSSAAIDIGGPTISGGTAQFNAIIPATVKASDYSWTFDWDSPQQGPALKNVTVSSPPPGALYRVSLEVTATTGPLKIQMECNPNAAAVGVSPCVKTQGGNSRSFPIVLVKYTDIKDLSFYADIGDDDAEIERKRLEHLARINDPDFVPAETNYFLCEPSDIKIIEDEIILKAANVTLPPASRVFFDIFDNSSGSGRSSAVANLIIWPITTLSTENPPGSGNFINIFDLTANNGFNCEDFDVAANVGPTCVNTSIAGLPLIEYPNFTLSAAYSIIPSGTSYPIEWEMDGTLGGSSSPNVEWIDSFDSAVLTGDRTAKLTINDGSTPTPKKELTVSNIGFKCYDSDREPSDNGEKPFFPGVGYGATRNRTPDTCVTDPITGALTGELYEISCGGDVLKASAPIDCTRECKVKRPVLVPEIPDDDAHIQGTCEPYTFPLDPSGFKAGYCKCAYTDETGVGIASPHFPSEITPTILFEVRN